jgi:hypothetical protein
MRRSTQPWIPALAGAALVMIPALGFAQTPTTTLPPTAASEAQQPAQATTSNNDAAKRHLTAARDTLSQLTQLPAAAQLTGEARTQTSQLISNFNELITAKADWPASYAKVETNLAALLGPASAPAGSPASTLDPTVRAKLTEFRAHLDRFEQAAAAPATPADSPTPATAPPATQQPPTTPPPLTTPPPTTQQPPPATPQPPAEEKPGDEDPMAHIAAIEAILFGQAAALPVGTSGMAPPPAGGTASVVTIDRAQLEQIKAHLAELKRLMDKKRLPQ